MGEGKDRWEGFTEEPGSHQAMKGESRLQIEREKGSGRSRVRRSQ